MCFAPIYLLPGLDGTGVLLERFKKASPPECECSVLSLPSDGPQTYDRFADRLSVPICASSKCVIVAESFSGPIAIAIASQFPTVVQAVVLVATFATPPVLPLAKLVPWRLVFRFPLPSLAARILMLGNDAPVDLVRELRFAARRVPVSVLAERVRTVADANVTAELATLKCPLMYLRPSADRLVPAHCLQSIRSLQPEIHVREIDGPHLVLQRCPTAAWHAISSFLQGLPYE